MTHSHAHSSSLSSCYTNSLLRCFLFLCCSFQVSSFNLIPPSSSLSSQLVVSQLSSSSLLSPPIPSHYRTITLPPPLTLKPTKPSPLSQINLYKYLTPSICKAIITKANADKGNTEGEWKLDEGRHGNYRTCDFSLLDEKDYYHDDDTSFEEVKYDSNGLLVQPELKGSRSTARDYLRSINFDSTMFNLITKSYNLSVQKKSNSNDPLDDFQFRDLFIIKYNTSSQSGLREHRDGSVISFSILLNPLSDFEAGGTQFKSLLQNGDGVVQVDQGDILLHPGKTLHGARDISSGERVVLIGFVHLPQYLICANSIRRLCTRLGQIDVCNDVVKRVGKLRGDGRLFYRRFKRKEKLICSPFFASIGIRGGGEVNEAARRGAEEEFYRGAIEYDNDNDLHRRTNCKI